MRHSISAAYGLAALLATAPAAPAQMLSGKPLADALKQGGYVIVMRHAASPREAPAKATANADNTNLERQLDEAGRSTSTAMGKAIRDLKIPIGDVFTSPTYRAMETVRFAGLSNPKTAPELGDNGQSMQGGTEAQAAWLKKAVATAPAKGTNTICVTHNPNLTRAFPTEASGVADGEALIFRPDGRGGATMIGRIKIEEWPQLR